MTLQQIQRFLLDRALVTIRLKMMLAPTTRYRSSVADEIEQVLLEIERVHQVTSPLPSRVRALLLLPKESAGDEVDLQAIIAYVSAVALGAPVSALAELVQSTGWPDLMRRLARYAPGPHQQTLREFAAVVEVHSR